MNAMNVKRLYDLLGDEIKKGNGDKNILLSDDDEGNGYHAMFYGITDANKVISEDDVYNYDVHNINDWIILG